MLARTLVAAGALTSLGLPGIAFADPNDPELRFWVQVNDDVTMLHMLVMGDPRINPIIVMHTPVITNTCGGDQRCPDIAACNVVGQLAAVTKRLFQNARTDR